MTRAERAVWVTVALALIGDVLGSLGFLHPRTCPACRQPWPWKQRGAHDCDWGAEPEAKP